MAKGPLSRLFPARQSASASPEAAGSDDTACFVILDDLTVVSTNQTPNSEPDALAEFRVTPGQKLQLDSATAQKQLSRAVALLKQNQNLMRSFVQLDDCEISRSRYLVLTHFATLSDSTSVSPQPGSGQARFLVTLCDLTAEIRLSEETLVECLGLTPMEARLCIAFLNERSLQDFADDSEVTISTARWHWRNIRDKLDVRTQLGLVRMLMRLAKP